jgi:ABC-type transporter MlaC component
VSTGSGTIDSIQSFGSGSITFKVTINQQVASTQPTTKVSGQYTVTVVSGAGDWQVSDIELFGLGNQ